MATCTTAGHVNGWKTLLACRLDEQAVVDHLRSSATAYPVPVEAPARGAA